MEPKQQQVLNELKKKVEILLLELDAASKKLNKENKIDGKKETMS